MLNNRQTVVIIGGGIAGLCAAVYAQRCGYQAEVIEMNQVPGGLATSWHRGGYTFETCLHWLLGSNPKSSMHAQWAEIFDIDKLEFLYPEEFVRYENERGECLRIYSDIDQLEAEMLRVSPADAANIRNFTSGVRRLSDFHLPDPSGGLADNWRTYLHDLPYVPLMRRLASVRSCEYGQRFVHPLLRGFFGDSGSAEMSAVALFFSLAWTNQRDAGYPIGGSQAIIRPIVKRLTELGGKLRLSARVHRILVKDGAAVGVELVDGEHIPAGWVISAADGHSTLYEMLGHKYIDDASDKIYREFETFPSYLQVSLGIAQNLSQQPGFFARLLETPLIVDPATQLKQLSFRIFNFDPTFACRKDGCHVFPSHAQLRVLGQP